MIKLYSTNCPKCKILEKKLNEKNIQYEITTDINEMTNLGFNSAPMLDVEGKVLDYGKAIKWVNNYVMGE